jgi:acyl-CoA thioesterase
MSLAAFLRAGSEHTFPSAWMQGRTVYGGLSSTLALTAAQGIADDLPPLRTAQISFIGPLAGTPSVEARLMRRGRTAAFVRSDLSGEAGLGLSGMFVFMHDQPSHIDHVAMPAPAALPESAVPMRLGEKVAAFVHNFEMIAVDSGDPASWTRWVRLKDRQDLNPMAELMIIADALPPGALALATKAGPISSMTWLVNLLTPRPETRDGWWLLRSTAEFARNGCSSQTMVIWNADGVPVASGMQSVALFL